MRAHKEYVELEANDARKGDNQDVNVFADVVKSSGAPPPGLPQFNPNRVVGHLKWKIFICCSWLLLGSWQSMDRDLKAASEGERRRLEVD